MLSLRVLAVCLLALWSPCRGYYNYQTRVPNGQRVPHPCKPNYIWHGLGHLNPLGGGGQRNQFGDDFAAQGHRWTAELCRKDSDGDGLTNGQELGDPQCMWREGELPASSDNITHPGVCDPWGSPQCRDSNTWVSCEVGEFKCDAIHDPDVKNLTLRFPRTKVPVAETTYECFSFEFPADETYHLVAHTPYIDNPNVMHHIIIYGCDETAELTDAPYDCNMGSQGCSDVIGVWTLGMTGECVHPLAGFRLGKGASTRLQFQFHWTNVQLMDDWYDASGVTLYYTPRLRPNDAGVLFNGQLSMVIPPSQPSVTHVGSCSSSCTSRFINGSINIITALNHMHYLGVRGKVEQIRDGQVVKVITNDDPYSYDNPKVYSFASPVVVLPGDELKMTCEFSSLGKGVTTYYGEGSYDEMCYGIFAYFPKQNFKMKDACIQWKETDVCDFVDSPCDYGAFFNTSNPDTFALVEKVATACRYGSCTPECPAVIAEVKSSNPCLGKLWEYVKYSVMNAQKHTHVDADILKLVVLLDSCNDEQQPLQQQQQLQQQPQQQPCPETQTQTQPLAKATRDADGAADRFIRLAKELGAKPLLQNIIFNVNKDD